MRGDDPEATADGASRVIAAAIAPTVPLSPPTAAADYRELVPVERRHYAISREIAKGGMGRVVEARDLRLGRQVAIKELLPQNRDAARRFEREARITARLQHPAIIHIYEAGVWPGGEPFYAMPRVTGRSLDKVVAERATLHERLALLANVIAAVDALAYAHSENVIHRDLKPANVLVGDFGETVVIDWGLAKDLGAVGDPAESLRMRAQVAEADTLSGSVVGTPAYMPPEQARGDAVDQRADVYSLGALLYKVLVGVAPYTASASSDVLQQVKAGPPPPIQEREPGAPADLIAIVEKAMARAPGDRYPTAGELAQDLKRFQTGQLVAAHRYSTWQLAWRWVKRYRIAVIVATLAVTALAIGGAFSVRRIVDEKDRAETQERRARAGRIALLEERGRSELLAGHAGSALAYLVAAAQDGNSGGARGFLLAEAMRPFDAEVKQLVIGSTSVATAISRDRVHIATASGRTVQLWSADGTLDHTFTAAGTVRALAVAPDGTWVAAGGPDGITWAWSTTGACVELAGQGGELLDLSFSSDGRRVATASSNHTARVWTISDRTSIGNDCHTGAVVSARFSADDERVVTASDDHTACIWSARTGKTLTPLRGHDGPVHTAVWGRDDAWVLTASDDGTARAWSSQLGKPLITPLRLDGARVTTAAVSPDFRSVVVAGDGARIWALPPVLAEDVLAVKLVQVGRLETDETLITATFSEDGALVATGGSGRSARVWDAASGQVIAAFEHGDLVTDVAFAAHDRLVTGSRDGSARMWDIRHGRTQDQLDSPVHAIAVSGAGVVAAGTDDSRVVLLRGGAQTTLDGHLGRVFAVAFTPDGARVISGGEDEQAIVWDVAHAQPSAKLGPHPHGLRAIAVSPDGARVATAASDGMRVWSLASRSLLWTGAGGTPLTSLAFDPHDGAIIAGGEDGRVHVWDADGVERGAPAVMTAAVSAVAFGPDGSLAAAGADDARMYASADALLARRAAISLDGPTGSIRAIAIAADGSRVITAGGAGIASVWDAAKGKLLGTRTSQGHASTTLALAGDTLWIGGEDGNLEEWDVRVETRPLALLEQFLVDKHVYERLGDDDVVHRIGGP